MALTSSLLSPVRRLLDKGLFGRVHEQVRVFGQARLALGLALVELVGDDGAFVSDGFGVVHRKQASVFDVAKLLPHYAGTLVAAEVKVLEQLTESTERPYAVVLGGYQVSQDGDLANWVRPNVGAPGVGGAMDLAAGAQRIYVMMTHNANNGAAKLLTSCTYPLTGAGVVDRIITNLGVLDVVTGGLKIVELADGVSEAELRAATEATIV